MSGGATIYLHVWTGDREKALALVREHLPGHSVAEISHHELRGGGWRGQIRGLHALRGEAFIVFFNSLDDAPQLQMVLWSGLIHRCRSTVVCDSTGRFQSYRRANWLRLFPRTLVSTICDGAVMVCSRVILQLGEWTAKPRSFRRTASTLDVAYLFPYPLIRDTAGGAMSHVSGVLGGLAANDARSEIFTGAHLPVNTFPLHEIPAKRGLYIFWESLMLSYSVRFAWCVRRVLKKKRPAIVYQRHGRFTVAGALVSKLMNVPLVLEYNASELWMSNYWDPTRFRQWLRLCEEVSLRSASLIVVVSDPIRQELLDRGIPGERVLVSPNAVDPDYFHPGCGGDKLRSELGIGAHEITIGFVGTFSPWHGISILQQAIQAMLSNGSGAGLRFLLVGTGSLHAEMRTALRAFEESRQVLLPGMVPHGRVREYLDAADILVSPHIRLPDGKPFFGSPTKLFEYMAMGKAIIASNLDQLAQVLAHNETAVLVEPGNVQELIEAIEWLEHDRALRSRLGAEARRVAVGKHTWKQNVGRVLAHTGCEARRAPSDKVRVSIVEKQAANRIR